MDTFADGDSLARLKQEGTYQEIGEIRLTLEGPLETDRHGKAVKTRCYSDQISQ